MGTPFLGRHDNARDRRSAQIFGEVTTYLEEVTVYASYIKRSDQLPPSAKKHLPVAPDKPGLMWWIDKIERWGLPYSGTWMDQPREFLEDLEAALLARDHFSIKKTDEPTSGVLYDAPPAHMVRQL